MLYYRADDTYFKVGWLNEVEKMSPKNQILP